MKSLWKNNRGATLVEYALVATPILFLILGIVQTAWVVWINNLLHISVNAAARCGAVSTSTMTPCYGSGLANMTQTANLVFSPLSGASVQPSWSLNTNCSDNDTGLIGTYQVTFLFAINLTLTAQSCYPTVIVPSST